MTLRMLLALALVASLPLTATIATAQDNKPDTDKPDTGKPAGNKPDIVEKGDGEAKEDTKSEEDKGEKEKDKGGGLFDGPIFPIMIGVMVLMIFMSSRGKKKQAAKQKQLLDALKKGDKVRTIGGILGTIVEVRDDEVVIKIDENSNTRMRVIRRAISAPIVDGKKDDDDAKK